MNAATEANPPLGRLAPLAWLFAGLLLLLSCESNRGSTGGETHFLRWCDDSQPCEAGLSCVCGVCSQACADATQCAGLPLAECLAAADASTCPDALALSRCDVLCDTDADCKALSASHTCELGTCRMGPLVSPGAGGATSCARGEVVANQVLLIGDSFFATSHQITAYLEGLARDAGVLPVGQRYRDNSSLLDNALAFGGGIAGQYERGQAEGDVRLVIMNGGGADVLMSRCEAPTADCTALHDAAAAATQLFGQMERDGVSDVLYAFYKDNLDVAVRERMDALRPLIQAACESSPVPCHWLDLRPTFAGRYDEYVLPDGRNPTDAGARATAETIWARMQRDCLAQ